ncbi:MAG TPA: AraC family transcriptional regulator [Chitinophagaceae bacterium]|nr:AraC family transcriptional regulator [Chitinophagaceae bacterium]
MHHSNVTHQSSQVSIGINKKVVCLNGNPAIEYYSYDGYHHISSYSEENRLLIIVEGGVKLTYGRLEYEVSQHQLVFLKNSTEVECQTIGDSGENNHSEFAIFYLNDDLIKEFSKLTSLAPNPGFDNNGIMITDVHHNFTKFMDSLTPYLHDSEKMDETLVKIKLLEMLFSLKQSDTRMINLLLDSKKELRPNLTTIMEDNLLNSLSLDQLARLAGRSLSSFRRDFISTYNMPPSQWIRERRLRKAREFLVTTRMTVTDICYTLGFENITHFSRLFKSQFGHSPSEYRMYNISNRATV